MRNTNKQAFTLVELIVVITILAILGTIAFLSLQGYSQDAKNTKVITNVSSLVTAIETKTAGNNGVYLKDVITSDSNVEIDNTLKVNSGSVINSSGVSYAAGPVDYKALKIKQDDFQFADNKWNPKPYIAGYAVVKDFVAYEVAGNIFDAAGNATVSLKWNYYKVSDANDAASLISASWASKTPVIDGDKAELY